MLGTKTKLINLSIIIGLFIFLLSVTFVKADDLNIDLGRHILSGELILKSHAIPQTNYFTYTNPDFPFVNHYWLTEVIFYELFSLFGLPSLFFLKELLIFCSVGILFSYSLKKYGAFAAGFASLLIIPIFIVRNTIRPELFGYLFFSLLLMLLLQFPKNKKYIILIPFMLLLWINLSITFVYGIFLVGTFLIAKRKLLKNKEIIFLLLSLLVLVINPHGIYGILEPFFLLHASVFQLSEMQSIFTAVQTYPHPIYTYIISVFLVTLGIVIYLIARKQWLLCIVLSVFLIMATLQNRNITFFIFIFIPACAFVIQDATRLLQEKRRIQSIRKIKIFSKILLAVLLLCLSIPFFTNSFYKTYDMKEEFGLGFYENIAPAINFMQKTKLPVNIFNNFDVSGYLIYKTYPSYKPFIDNRPEAYPSNFIEENYFPVFTDARVRKKVFKNYHIHTVFLQLDSGDQRSRKLALLLSKDKTWRLVYLDSSAIIFTKAPVADIRKTPNQFTRDIKSNNNYLELGKLASNFALLGYLPLAENALQKANMLNPDSCNIKRLYYQSNVASGNQANADFIKNTNWQCFFYL